MCIPIHICFHLLDGVKWLVKIYLVYKYVELVWSYWYFYLINNMKNEINKKLCCFFILEKD
jgi:hypothetical protein